MSLVAATKAFRPYNRTFTLAELQEGSEGGPADLDRSHLEEYLQEDEFERALGMDIQAFGQLKAWKQRAAKEKAGLF